MGLVSLRWRHGGELERVMGEGESKNAKIVARGQGGPMIDHLQETSERTATFRASSALCGDRSCDLMPPRIVAVF